MSDIVIRAQGLGKKYIIGHAAQVSRDHALRDVIARGARTFLRGASDLLHGRPVIAGDQLEDFWALRDVDFEIERGEVVGIFGRNGAGKSTLLKILSRITEPTAGRVSIKGRVASLLEVGTGFHGELTGRENIFLNGAILGMSRTETSRKFDEIVAFAEVDRFLDTPVKRYSSGMYVRLAFAVAAHLEPEILIVDEVLAVGDAQFQDKCLGKIKSVAAGEGRTVLFVSHNMAAISSLTQRAMLLSGGKVAAIGETASVVSRYLADASRTASKGSVQGRGAHTRIVAIKMIDGDGIETTQYVPGQTIKLAVEIETDGSTGLSVELLLFDSSRRPLGLSSLYQFHGEALPSRAGRYLYEIELCGIWLAADRYSLDVSTSVANITWDHYVEQGLTFEVAFSNPGGRGWDFRVEGGFGPLALRGENVPRFTALSRVQTEIQEPS